MSIAPASAREPKDSSSAAVPGGTEGTRSTLAWSSFFFALLQSICGAFVAMSGLRLALGVSSLAFSAGAATLMGRLHADKIRVPMMIAALLGSLLNLAILAQVRHLRARPASQWRRKPVTPRQLKMERVQIILSVATLVLLLIEGYLHLRFHHRL